MSAARTSRALTAVALAGGLIITSCSSEPATSAGSVAPPASSSDVSAPTTTRAPDPTTTVTTVVADVTMEEFQGDVAEICAPGAAALATLPSTDGTIETVRTQLAMLKEAYRERIGIEDVVFPTALRTQMDEVIEATAAGDAALAASEAAAAAGDAALAAEQMEQHLDALTQIAVRFAIMGASCGPVEAGRAAQAALSVPVDGNPDQIALGFGSVWLSALDGGKVVRLDADTGEVLATIDVGERPLKAQPADGRLWVRTADAFVRIDPNTNAVDATLLKADVGPAANRNFAVDGTMWVCDGRQLHRYDPTSLERTSTIDLDIDCDYVQAWDDLVIAWVYNDDPSLSAEPAAAMIDPATDQVLATIPLPVDVLAPAVFDDRIFFGGNMTSTAVVIERADWTIVETPDLGRVTHGGNVATDGESIYIPAKDSFPGDVLVVDADTYDVVDRIEPLDVNGLAVDSDGSLWVAGGILGVAQRFDRAG